MWPQPNLAILFRPFGFLALIILMLFGFPIFLTLSLHDGGISTFLFYQWNWAVHVPQTHRKLFLFISEISSYLLGFCFMFLIFKLIKDITGEIIVMAVNGDHTMKLIIEWKTCITSWNSFKCTITLETSNFIAFLCNCISLMLQLNWCHGKVPVNLQTRAAACLT